MGWLWSSPPPAASSTPQDKPISSPSQSTPAPPTSTPQSTTSKPPTRAELEEAELQSFLRDIDSDVTATKPTKYTRSSQSQASTTSPSSSSTADSPLAEQLLPTTMSCRTAFDTAFYCNSLGGRFNDVYRYGTIKSCSESWSDFWFCMRTRTQSSPSKELAIQEHYRQKERMKYGKGLGRESSEDVWQSRETKVGRGEAFMAEFEEFKGSDEEWREEQRRWREGMGKEEEGGS